MGGGRLPLRLIIQLVAVAGFAASAAAADGPPRAGLEIVPPGEPTATAAIIAMIEAGVKSAYVPGKTPARRDAHAKGHGCVKGTFTVDRFLPPGLRQGVFAKPAAFAAWVRFSNGNGAPHDDHVGDGRGMAIKLVGVPGPKLLGDEAATQDFVMINYPVFFVANAADYVVFTRLSLQNKSNQFFAAHPREAAISKAITAISVDQALEQRYFSMTPYRLGAQVIKFGAIPVDCASGARLSASKAAPPAGDPDYLRKAMAKWLAAKDACFDFAVQPRTDPAAMPVENPTVLWDEAAAPFVKIARLRIPAQRFDSPTQQSFCENLSYSPWHSLAAMRPIGGINRIRKPLYQAISTLRHGLNGARKLEPNGGESFDQGEGDNS